MAVELTNSRHLYPLRKADYVISIHLLVQENEVARTRYGQDSCELW